MDSIPTDHTEHITVEKIVSVALKEAPRPVRGGF